MRVRVVAGSRLHAGFHVVGDRLKGISYMGAGFYVEEPRVVVEVDDDCGAQVIEAGVFMDVARLVASKTGFTGCIRVVRAPPRHHGLGSTTQVALSIYHAVQVLRGRSPGPGELVEAGVGLLGRSVGSTVGSVLYAYGGFASGIGVPPPKAYTPLRLEVPEWWRFIIVIPGAAPGMSEEGERVLLEDMPEPLESVRAMMARGFHALLVGLVRRDLYVALEGLRMMQVATGRYFSKHQGGVYRRDLAAVADEASRDGIFLAQSSWGPTLYTITEEDAARSDAKTLRMVMDEVGVAGSVLIASPRNTGGVVEGGSI